MEKIIRETAQERDTNPRNVRRIKKGRRISSALGLG
jgi:hypothetical protein